MFKEGERRYEMMNKKGLSDIVTTALIILLVAVAVVAIWAFVGPALKGTGQQFNRAQTCIANQLDVTSCQAVVLDATGGKYAALINVRRTLADGVAQLKSYKVDILGGSNPSSTADLGTATATTGKTQLPSQGSTVALAVGVQGGTAPINYPYEVVDAKKTTGGVSVAGCYTPTNCPTPPEVLGAGAQARAVATYENPDKSLIICQSLPLTCQTSSGA